MVVIDSSESSSDEEDRRLRPTCHAGTDSGVRPPIFDASEKPEGTKENKDYAATKCYVNLNSDDYVSNVQTPYQAKNGAVGSLTECNITGQQIVQDIADQIISHTRSLEGFMRKIDQIPSRSAATNKFHIGLQLINEYIQSIHDVSVSGNNIDASDVFQYSSSVHNSEKCMEGWYNAFDGTNYLSLESDVDVNDVLQKHKARNVENASSQTNISGDVIPREATAALEFFQELIKNS